MIKKPTFDEEKFFWGKETYVIGVDEVGKGCFAGPVVACAFMLPIRFSLTIPDLNLDIQNLLKEVDDSKRVSPQKRERLVPILESIALTFGIKEIDVPIINKVGIGKATYMAMEQAIASVLEDIPKNSEYIVLVDGLPIPNTTRNQKGIIKGDQKSFSIAASSILAKVYRDKKMEALDIKYPNYVLKKNKGYGTKEHRDAIKKHGLSSLHRTSFDLLKFTV